MTDLVKELLIFVGIFAIIVVAALAVRSGGKTGNEANHLRKDINGSGDSYKESKSRKNNRNM